MAPRGRKSNRIPAKYLKIDCPGSFQIYRIDKSPIIPLQITREEFINIYQNISKMNEEQIPKENENIDQDSSKTREQINSSDFQNMVQILSKTNEERIPKENENIDQDFSRTSQHINTDDFENINHDITKSSKQMNNQHIINNPGENESNSNEYQISEDSANYYDEDDIDDFFSFHLFKINS